MKSKYKVLLAVLMLAFFLFVPLASSLFFSSHTNGVISVDKKIQADYIQSDKHIILVFFGYVGCEKVCTPILQNLANLYASKKFDAFRDKIDIYFINLTPQIDPTAPNLFAKYFNKDFKGVYLSQQELFKIDRNFGVFFSKSLEDKEELNHTDNIFLLENIAGNLRLKKIYTTHPLNETKITEDIMQMLSSKNTKAEVSHE